MNADTYLGHPLPDPANTVYHGTRDNAGEVGVWRNDRPFDPAASLKVRNHSPTGFEWGYGGSGPAQLALALLLDATDGNQLTAEDFYQRFKWEVVARFDKRSWRITRQQILAWLADQICPLPTDPPRKDGGK